MRMTIDSASGRPIQIASTRSPTFSRRTTTNVSDVASKPMREMKTSTMVRKLVVWLGPFKGAWSRSSDPRTNLAFVFSPDQSFVTHRLLQSRSQLVRCGRRRGSVECGACGDLGGLDGDRANN